MFHDKHTQISIRLQSRVLSSGVTADTTVWVIRRVPLQSTVQSEVSVLLLLIQRTTNRANVRNRAPVNGPFLTRGIRSHSLPHCYWFHTVLTEVRSYLEVMGRNTSAGSSLWLWYFYPRVKFLRVRKIFGGRWCEIQLCSYDMNRVVEFSWLSSNKTIYLKILFLFLFFFSPFYVYVHLNQSIYYRLVSQSHQPSSLYFNRFFLRTSRVILQTFSK